jgi:hypothetical protein
VSPELGETTVGRDTTAAVSLAGVGSVITGHVRPPRGQLSVTRPPVDGSSCGGRGRGSHKAQRAACLEADVAVWLPSITAAAPGAATPGSQGPVDVIYAAVDRHRT